MKQQEYLIIENLIYKEKKFTEAIEKIDISPFSKDKEYLNLKAQALFRLKKFGESRKIFEKINDFYNVGYCYLLEQKVDLAKKYFIKAENSPAQNWELFFCELFSGDINIFPSYLQIRAFLERDLNIFLQLNLTEYVQKIIDISEYLFSINPETNKFIAKVFLYNNYFDYAIEFLNRGLDFTDIDGELYYLLAIYYNSKNNTEMAIDNLKKALKINENYLPAQLLLEKINSTYN